MVELAPSAAQEYLCELEHDNEEIPPASKVEAVKADERPDGFVKLIELDADAFRPAGIKNTATIQYGQIAAAAWGYS